MLILDVIAARKVRHADVLYSVAAELSNMVGVSLRI